MIRNSGFGENRVEVFSLKRIREDPLENVEKYVGKYILIGINSRTHIGKLHELRGYDMVLSPYVGLIQNAEDKLEYGIKINELLVSLEKGFDAIEPIEEADLEKICQDKNEGKALEKKFSEISEKKKVITKDSDY